MKKTLRIAFGALSDPLHVQCDVPPSILEWEQKLADAIVLLNIQLIMTDGEKAKAHKRLTKRIIKIVSEYRKDQERGQTTWQ